MDKLIGIFLFFLLGLFKAYCQEDNLNKYKEVPFSIFEGKSQTEDLSQLLASKPTFIPFKEFDKDFKFSQTYWLKVNLTKEFDTLLTRKQWRLHTSSFEFAEMYFNSSEGIDSYTFGMYNMSETRSSVDYHPGIPFESSSLVDGHLYIKFYFLDAHYNFLKKIRVFYTSEETNEFFSKYYSQGQVNKFFQHYAFFGLCLIVFICFVFIYGVVQKREFLYYALYVFFSGVYLVTPDLPFDYVIHLIHNRIAHFFLLSSQIYINLFYCLFLIYYLNTRKDYPKLHVFLKGIIIILTVSVFADILGKLLGFNILRFYLFNFQRILMTLFGVVGMIYLLLKAKNQLAYFIVLGSFCYMLGAWGYFFFADSSFMVAGITLEIIIFTLGIAYKVNSQYKAKLLLQKEVSQKEISALRAQINPHFIFNSLNSIQHLILTDDKMGALKYLNQFGKLTRSVLDNSNQTKVSLTDEIKVLRSYLELESLRFDNTFSYKIEIDDVLDTDDVEIPLLLIQPFVENSIIHGLMPKQFGDKKLIIRFKLEGEDLICEVEDNGVGRIASQSLKSTTKKSRGMEITEKRLKLISSSNRKAANINIEDKLDAKGEASGTKVIIRILAA